MEKETGAKIIIRGKGSVKEGKVGRKDGQPLPGEDEPLHAYVTAPDAESVSKAVRKIRDVIRQGVEVPEGSNELRKMQVGCQRVEFLYPPTVEGARPVERYAAGGRCRQVHKLRGDRPQGLAVPGQG